MMDNPRYDPTHEKGLKVLTPKQMVPRLPIDIAQVKASNSTVIY